MLCFKTFKDYVSVCVCVYVYLCGVCVCINVGAHTGQKKASDPLELELQTISHGCQEVNLDSLEEPQLFFTTEPSLQPSCVFSIRHRSNTQCKYFADGCYPSKLDTCHLRTRQLEEDAKKSFQDRLN